MLLSFPVSDANPLVEFDLKSRAGLSIKLDSIPLVRGSFFQIYEPGWTKGYYSSNWNEQEVTSLPGGVKLMEARDPSRSVVAKIKVTPEEDQTSVEYTFSWTGSEPVAAEVSFGHLWAPAIKPNSITIDGQPARSLEIIPSASDTIEQRRLGPKATILKFATGQGTVSAQLIGAKADIFDARNFASDWSAGQDLLWFGASDIELQPGKPTTIMVFWKFVPLASAVPKEEVKLNPQWKSAAKTYGPLEGGLPLAPLPAQYSLRKSATKDFVWGNLHEISGDRKFRAPFAAVRQFLMDRWAGFPSEGGPIQIAVKDLKMASGGYKLSVENGTLRIVGQDDEGLRNGLWRAATLAQPKEGKLTIAPVLIEDQPKLGWRGVHQFVGPRALPYQSRLMDRVLSPMLMNQVVLQAERVNWESIPGTQTSITMKKEVLQELVNRYRSRGIEPTPLIQSFGHMEWLFANGQNRDLALSPNALYAVDPQNPRTADLLGKIWNEVCELFQPKIIHFGLDEVDMRGKPGSDDFVTKLWKLQLESLDKIAKQNNAAMMIWGDMALAPGEAPDATNGVNKRIAKERRDAIPKGTWIADWHYKNDDNPKIYSNLALWANEGFKPVASTWNRPENIKGFFEAASAVNGGALQTTWAGYESTEENMVREFDQLVAYVLAGEYSWSNRKERAAQLPYAADDLLRRLYSPNQIPLSSQSTYRAVLDSSATPRVIGNYEMLVHYPIPLYSKLQGDESPKMVRIPVDRKASKVVIALGCKTVVGPMDTVARIRLVGSAGTKTKAVAYARDIRAHRDTKAALMSARNLDIFAVEVDTKDIGTLKEVQVLSDEAMLAGPELYGASFIP